MKGFKVEIGGWFEYFVDLKACFKYILESDNFIATQGIKKLSEIRVIPMELKKCNHPSCKNFVELKKRHINDFHSLFSRVDLQLGQETSYMKMPTDKRLQLYLESLEEVA